VVERVKAGLWKRLLVGAVVALPGFAALASDGLPFGDRFGGWLTIVVVAAWVIALMIALYNTSSHEARVDQLANDQTASVQERFATAAGAIYRGLLTGSPPTGIPFQRWSFFIYLWDGNKLRPVWWDGDRTVDEDLYSFDPGQGATGVAYVDKSFVKVSGESVSNAEYDLTDAQQKEFSALRRVVAMPIFAATGGDVIGVLTGQSLSDTDGFEDEANVSALRNASDVIGVVLERLGPSARL